MKPTTNELNEARRQKALDRLYNFSGRVMTLGAFLGTVTITKKTVWVQEYSSKKICLEYKKITPRSHYTVWYLEDGKEVGIDVPKLVFDAIQPTGEKS